MPLPNDKNTSALQQLTFLDDLVASERRNISDVIFRRIRDAIISGELPPGYVFPNENELWPQQPPGSLFAPGDLEADLPQQSWDICK